MGPHRRIKRQTRRGFTLLEVLLVLVILGVIAGLVVPRLFGTQERAMVQKTEADIKGLENTLQLYAIDHFATYPETLDDLLQPQDEDGNQMNPYLDNYPRDAWRQPFNYQVEHDESIAGGLQNARIWSNGPNRQNDDGLGDDINNWDDQLVE